MVVEAGGRDRLVIVEQGPEWLAALLLDPPLWFVLGLAGVICLLAAGALWSYKEYVDSDVIEAIGFTLAVVGCVGGSVWVLRPVFEF